LTWVGKHTRTLKMIEIVILGIFINTIAVPGIDIGYLFEGEAAVLQEIGRTVLELEGHAVDIDLALDVYVVWVQLAEATASSIRSH